MKTQIYALPLLEQNVKIWAQIYEIIFLTVQSD